MTVAPYITDTQLAEVVGKSREFVQDRCRQKEWPHLKVGSAYRFKPEHLEQIEALCEVPVTAPPPAATWGSKRRRRSAS